MILIWKIKIGRIIDVLWYIILYGMLFGNLWENIKVIVFFYFCEKLYLKIVVNYFINFIFIIVILIDRKCLI